MPLDHDISHPTDPDLAAQAKPGHGIPSQDPAPLAQRPIADDHAADEEKTVYMGAGVLAGAAAGAAIGTAVGGPLGVVVGGTIGAVAGALGGAAVGAANPPDAEDLADKAPPSQP